MSFDRWVDHDVGEGEGLRVLIGNHGVYKPLHWWQAGDSTWHRATFTLTADKLSEAVTLRFVGIPTREFNQSPKQIAIDNVVITEDAPTLTVSTITGDTTAHPQPSDFTCTRMQRRIRRPGERESYRRQQ